MPNCGRRSGVTSSNCPLRRGSTSSPWTRRREMPRGCSARMSSRERSKPRRLAESLLREPFLSGENGTWAQTKRRELERVHTRALDVLAEASIRSGEAATAVRWAEQAVEAEPFRESGHRRLMEAHAASGNRAEALRAYDRCRHLLAEELGAFPSPETEAVYRRLLEAPPAPPPATPPRTAARVRRYRRRIALAAAALRRRRRRDRIHAHRSRCIGLSGAAEQRPPRRPEVAEGDRGSVCRRRTGSDRRLRRLSWVTNHILRWSGSGAPRYAGDHTLTRIDPASGKTTVVGGGLAPCGITSDPSGDVWVANCYPPIAGLRDDLVRVDGQSSRVREDVARSGRRRVLPRPRLRRRLTLALQIDGGDRTNANTITGSTPRQVRRTRSTSHVPRPNSPGRAPTASSGSTTSTTEASHDYSPTPERHAPSTMSPTRRPFQSSTAISSGSATGQGRRSCAYERSDLRNSTASTFRKALQESRASQSARVLYGLPRLRTARSGESTPGRAQ